MDSVRRSQRIEDRRSKFETPVVPSGSVKSTSGRSPNPHGVADGTRRSAAVAATQWFRAKRAFLDTVDREKAERRGFVLRHPQKASIIENHMKRLSRLKKIFALRNEILESRLKGQKGNTDAGAQLDTEQKLINEIMQKTAAERKDKQQQIANLKELRNQLRARRTALAEAGEEQASKSAKAKGKAAAKAKAATSELGSPSNKTIKTRSGKASPESGPIPGLDNKAKKAKTVGDTPKSTSGQVSERRPSLPPPAQEPEPIVEFVGAPVGKGAKVPTGLWPWPGPGEGMAMRQRGRKQTALAMMPQPQNM